MFLKPFKTKSNTPLKGSDIKKLRQRVEKSYPNIKSEELQMILPNKGNVTVLKITTHNEFQSCVFCVDKLPMFFEIEGGIIAPTLYCMWQLPDLLPYFTTFKEVLPKLSNGADLMLPGVVHQGTGMNIYGRYKKGELVAVNLTSNKSAVGIGTLVRSSDDLYMCGGHGSAIKMLHIFGDKLWGIEPSLSQQIPAGKHVDLKEEDFPVLGAKVQKDKEPAKKEEEIPFTDQVETSVSLQNDISELLENVEISPSVTEKTLVDNIENSQDHDMDIILRNAFLSALKNHGKNLTLPLLTSNFYRLYVVPEATATIDLKKTKYKKLSNFLNDMVNEGFVVIREEAKGVDKIFAIDFEHPELVNFVTDFKSPTETLNSQNQPLFHSELMELYLVTDETAPFFTKMNYKRGEGVPSNMIKKIVREYISKNNLKVQNVLTGELELDDCLAAVCESPNADIRQICNILLSKMQHSYQMQSIKDAPRNKPCIQMSLAKRTGNKKVTLVTNIECYGIIVPEFIKLCKQGAAASATTIKLPNQKYDTLQIQGNQVRFVYNLLIETYKVPAKYILGLELAKGSKKSKN